MVIRLLKLLLVLVCLFGIWFIWSNYRHNKNHYISGLQSIHFNQMNFVYYSMFDEFFELNSEFPNSYSDLDYLLRESAMYQADFRLFDDLFSKKEGKVIYHPIYNHLNYKRSGYILFSAGIDGVVNNQLENEDTIFDYEVYSKLKFYNRLEPSCRNIEYDTVPQFQYLNFLLGKKDYLISHVICE